MKKDDKYFKLKMLVKKKNYTLKEFAGSLGMSEPGFHQAIKNDTFKLPVLQDMAKILGVSLDDLFRDKPPEVRDPAARYGLNESERLFNLEDRFNALESKLKNKGII